MLFNKSIQQKYLKFRLHNEEELKILRLFLKKMKLTIEEINIRRFFSGYMMKKEDFELIQPQNVNIEVTNCFNVSVLPSNLKSLTLFFKDNISMVSQ